MGASWHGERLDYMAYAGIARTTMCVTAILYRSARDAPILVASNREEFFDRLSQPPRIQSGKPRVICGIDRKSGGTWLGRSTACLPR